MINIDRIKSAIVCTLSVFLLFGCTTSPPISTVTKVGGDVDGGKAIKADPNAVLAKIGMLLRHAKLEDEVYFSKLFDIALAGGELESGRGDMAYTCALGDSNTREWVGRRYRYETAPEYFSVQEFASTSKCFNPYVVKTSNPIHAAVVIRIDVKTDKLCISESDIKRHFPSAYFSESGGGFSVRDHWGTADDPIVMGIDSTHSGRICAKSIFFDQDSFYLNNSDF